MKKLYLFTFAVLLLRFDAAAQIPVTDVAGFAQDTANEVLNLAEYIEMVSNQVEQINSLTQQLQQVTAYVKAFGDPSSLLEITGVSGLVADLQQSGVGQTIGELQQLASGVEALKANANGLYGSITDITSSGINVPRPEELYRKFAAVDRTTENYTTVYDDVVSRRKALKGQMVATAQQLQSASTDAETQKLSGVLASQGAELQALDSEVGFAASQALVQDIANRADAQKQENAHNEEIAADRHDALKKAGSMLVPDVTSDILQEMSNRK
ncbi:MAG: hypothetical protein ABJC63_13020 [Gemmatimonadales bacterium]